MLTPAGTPEAPAKPCRTCAEPIRPAARKCVRCGAYQDGRRFFDLGNTTLSLVIALISVLGATAPTFDRLLTPTNRQLSVSLQAVSQGVMVVRITNPNSQAAFVEGANLTAGRNRGFLFRPLAVAPDQIGAGQLIDPKSSKSVRLSATGGVDVYRTDESACILYLSYYFEDGRVGIAQRKLPCSRLANLDRDTYEGP